MTATREKIVEAARSFIGTPFHHQGRRPGVGLDCVGVVVCAGRAAGLEVGFDVAGYSRVQGGGLVYQVAKAELLEADPARPGDILLFAFDPRCGLPQHAGILATETSFVHAPFGFQRKPGRVHERELTDAWRDRIYATFSFVGAD